MERDLVVIESPYKGSDNYESLTKNINYTKAALLDCLIRGEIPFASHLLYTQVLRDTSKVERKVGIATNLAMIGKADKVAVYMDHGITKGMQEAIDYAKEIEKTIEYRFMFDDKGNIIPPYTA